MTSGEQPPDVDLHSPDGSDFLHLTVKTRDGARHGYPSVQVEVEARTRGFSGHAPVHLAEEAVRRFVQELEGFEGTRRGAVQLEAMSPDVLRLTLSSMDSTGHVLVEFAFRRGVHIGHRPGLIDLQISGAFELEPTTLPALVRAFRTLVS